MTGPSRPQRWTVVQSQTVQFRVQPVSSYLLYLADRAGLTSSGLFWEMFRARFLCRSLLVRFDRDYHAEWGMFSFLAIACSARHT